MKLVEEEIKMDQHNHNHSSVEGRLTSLEIRMAVAESDIKNVRDDITSIKDDTRWLRRAFTNALIVATVGGIIGLGFVVIQFIMKGGNVG